MVARFDNQRFESALKQVSSLVTETVESRCEGRLQPSHTLGQVAHGRGQAQMEVIGHDAIRLDLPTETPACLGETGFECCLRTIGFEYERTIVASVDDVIESITADYAILPRHTPKDQGIGFRRQTDN